MNELCLDGKTIAVIGLGYVGLPLAVAFGKIRTVIGFDINKNRIKELNNNIDQTLEIDANELAKASHLMFTDSEIELSKAAVFIITVPTPIDENNEPDLSHLKSASKLVGKYIKNRDVVIFESTVYPGATEEICLPILENISHLKCIVDENNDYQNGFYIGYSPERINPGDKNKRIENIIKIISGSTPEIAKQINKMYGDIINAGTFIAKSIKIAEAAKIIENTQRDLNIALINELAIIFNKLDIDTESVLQAAQTKWNFIPFKPGLVGGHCIGVDPYYITSKAKSVGYEPKVILAGRKLNDDMSLYVAERLKEKMTASNIKIKKSNILIMGLTFKENCPDIRNSKVFQIIDELKKSDCRVTLFDPWVADKKIKNINITTRLEENSFDAILIAVAHECFREMGIKKIRSFGKIHHIVFDMKCIFSHAETDMRL